MRKGLDHTGISIVYYCHDGKGNFVMARRSQNCRDERGLWDIGGGALEFGEKVEAALSKEIKEEYCAEVLDCEFLGFSDVHRTHEGEKTHWLALEFKVRVDPEKVRIGEPHKFDEIAWFSLEGIPEDIHSQLPEFFRKYQGRLGV